MKKINAQNLLKKNPHELIRRSIRGMLPKNKLEHDFLINLKIYNEAGHDIPFLPQFGHPTPIDFHSMFGIDSAPANKIIPDPYTTESEIAQAIKQGYTVDDKEEYKLRDYWRKKTYDRINPQLMGIFDKKLFATRVKKYRRIRMKNYRYL